MKKSKNVIGYRFKQSKVDLKLRRKRKSYSPKKVDITEPGAYIESFIELIEPINPEMADEVKKVGLPKRVFLSKDIYYQVKSCFEVYPLKVIYHKHLPTKTIKFSWNNPF